MANLFVIHTPLQMLVSQQIIRQEKLSDNILIESCWEGHEHFLKIYDVCCIDNLWNKKYTLKDFACWDNQGIGLIKNYNRTRRYYNIIKKILYENNITSIYLADYQNQTMRFTTVLFSKQGYKIIFFEEGYSQYVKRPGVVSTSILARVKENIIDYFYFLPIWKIKFARWRNNPNMPYNGLPIYKRYSIVPGILQEKYDERLFCEKMTSEKLYNIIKSEINQNRLHNSILLLTDPMTEVLNKRYQSLYFDVIEESLSEFNKDSIVYIKYHPREDDYSKKKIIDIVKSLNMEYIIIGNRINIPVEYYLQEYEFKEILFFNTSTFFYNGYIYPQRHFRMLLPTLYNKCINEDIKQEELKYMKELITKMENLKFY